MVLNDLYNYYDKKLRGKYPVGSRLCDVDVVIVIDHEGNFVGVETDYRGKLVPFAPKRTSATKPYIVCDKVLYVLGFADEMTWDTIKKVKTKNEKSDEEVKAVIKEKIDSFINKTNEVYNATNDQDVKSICLFYEKDGVAKVIEYASDPQNGVELTSDKIVTFRLVDSDELVASKPSLFELSLKDIEVSDREEICCITGKPCHPIANCTLADLQTYSFVTFQKSQGYDNYEIDSQCLNTPISVEGNFGYSTAFRHLCNTKKNQFCLGGKDNRVNYLFFTTCDDDTESEIGDLMSSLIEYKPEEEIAKVRATIFGGKPINAKSTDEICIMGYTIDCKRLKIVYYNKCTVKKFIENINKHMSYYVHDDRLKDFGFGVYAIFRNALKDNEKKKFGETVDSHKATIGSLVMSILNGYKYDETIAQEYIRRINVGGTKNNETHDAFFRAVLNRNYKIDLNMLLPKNIEDNHSIGFLLGRYMALSARINMKASNDPNKKSYSDFPVVRDNKKMLIERPVAVINRIASSNVYYAGKSRGAANWLLSEADRVMSLMYTYNDVIPSKLSPKEKYEFELGFSTQWTSFFEKREKTEESE